MYGKVTNHRIQELERIRGSGLFKEDSMGKESQGAQIQ
jgi:hypothetical protein